MGLAAALVYPATLAILNNVFTVARERAIAIGVWSAVSGLAVAIGPVSGGALLRHFSWSSVFYVSVPVVVLAVVAGRLLLPESRDPDAGRFDPLGAILSAAGIALLTWSIIEAPQHGWGSVATVGGIAGSLVDPGAPSPGGRCGGPTRCSTCGCSATPGSARRARRSRWRSSGCSGSSS